MPGKYKWDKKYLYWGITAFLVIAGSIVFFQLLSKWLSLKSILAAVLKALTPFIYGFVFAYLFNKVMSYFESAFLLKAGNKAFPKNEKKAKRFSRVAAIILTLMCFFIVIGGMCWLVLPQIYTSLKGLVEKFPEYYETVVAWVDQFFANNQLFEETALNVIGNISDAFANFIEAKLIPQADSIIANITSGVFGIIRVFLNILIGIVVSIYILYHRESFCGQAKKITYGLFKPSFANKLLEDMRFVDKTCGGFITGKIIDSLIIGVICYIVLVILRMPYAALVSVIVCITNVIPVFGPFIGAVPSGLLILLDSPSKCLAFVIFIIILQQIDGNILGPKILGNTIGLGGFWIMFAILFFGGIFGFWGMLLGVPILAMIYAAVKSKNAKKLESKAMPTETETFYRIKYIDPETNEPVFWGDEEEDSMRPSEKRKIRRAIKKQQKSSDGEKKN